MPTGLCMEAKGQLAGVSYLFGFQGLNSVQQPWWQACLITHIGTFSEGNIH